MNSTSSKPGFTLIELIVVVSVLAILAGAMIPRINNRMASARDARRLADVQELRAAIERYHADHGTWPAARQNEAYGGWDVSLDGDLVPELFAKGYLDQPCEDPLNDDLHHYRYYVYDQGAFGCKSTSSFYVLGIRAFETPDFAAKNEGYFKCSGRDWSSEFAYVTGGGASWR
jgi:prepilin-type N-terminal cleavage/methylation domain-containing protein